MFSKHLFSSAFVVLLLITLNVSAQPPRPYWGTWSDGNGKLITISPTTISKTTNYKEISVTSDNQTFYLELQPTKSKKIQDRFWAIYLMDEENDQIHIYSSNSQKNLDSMKNIKMDVTWYKKSDYQENESQSSISIESFWKEFQTAVLKDDKDKIIELTEFPFTDPISGETINESQFKDNFTSYFDKRNKVGIKKTKIKSLKKETVEGETVYTLSFNYGESNWVFYFGLRSGSYKLFKMDFAG